ncbi:MAG: sugar phosphate isomerase/epimerase [Armatimonadetes bacterium]|nr:sugar phosphate isomerase/epimerase [Armatimonadota bacterium]
MKMDRRTLLLSGVAAGAAIALDAPGVSAAARKTKAVQKISSQEGIIPGKDLPEKLAKMEKWGFDGFEVGGGGLADRVDEIKKAVANSPLKLSAICAGFQGALASDDEQERKKCVRTMKEILSAAGELGSTGLIYVPAFNGQTKLNHVDARKVIVDQLPDLADYAQKAGTRLLLEPLNRGETWLIRQCADAAAICRDVNHPACCCMGDMYHMYIEEPNDLGAFISARDYIHHVHLASIKRNLPHQDNRDFRNGFAGLKLIGYQDFMSLECGVIGDREVEIPKTVKFLRKQWAEAEVA